MAQKKIVIDANAYLRLAKPIHPLLSTEFGADKYCLYVTEEIDNELANSTRISTNFSWVSEDQYRLNRTKHPYISKKQIKEIRDETKFLFDYVIHNMQGMGLSRVDCSCVAYSHIMECPLVSDDKAISDLAQIFEFDIKIYSTLELLKKMFDSSLIARDKLHQIIQYMHYMLDIPGGLRKFSKEFDKLFGYNIEPYLETK